jgi:hypothetical protein
MSVCFRHVNPRLKDPKMFLGALYAQFLQPFPCLRCSFIKLDWGIKPLQVSPLRFLSTRLIFSNIQKMCKYSLCLPPLKGQSNIAIDLLLCLKDYWLRVMESFSPSFLHLWLYKRLFQPSYVAVKSLFFRLALFRKSEATLGMSSVCLSNFTPGLICPLCWLYKCVAAHTPSLLHNVRSCLNSKMGWPFDVSLPQKHQ